MYERQRCQAFDGGALWVGWAPAVDAHRDRAGVAPGAAPAQPQHRLPAAVPEDGVAGVARRSAGTPVVRPLAIDRVGERIREVELARVDDLAADVHLDVDVHGPALVPAGVDRLERSDPARVRPLDAAHEGARVAVDAGVGAERVAVPDVDGRAFDRLAGRGVDDRKPEEQRSPRPPLRYLAAELLAGDVVRALRLLRREHARYGAGGDGRRAAFGGRALPGAEAERAGGGGGGAEHRDRGFGLEGGFKAVPRRELDAGREERPRERDDGRRDRARPRERPRRAVITAMFRRGSRRGRTTKCAFERTSGSIRRRSRTFAAVAVG